MNLNRKRNAFTTIYSRKNLAGKLHNAVWSKTWRVEGPGRGERDLPGLFDRKNRVGGCWDALQAQEGCCRLGGRNEITHGTKLKQLQLANDQNEAMRRRQDVPVNSLQVGARRCQITINPSYMRSCGKRICG